MLVPILQVFSECHVTLMGLFWQVHNQRPIHEEQQCAMNECCSNRRHLRTIRIEMVIRRGVYDRH